jgi:phage-related protein
MVIHIPRSSQREIEDFPADVRGDLADALARLEQGHSLSMPLSRPMTGIGPGVHELRLSDRSGAYRVVYALVVRGTVHVLHAFKKTTRSTPRRDIDIARRRFGDLRERLKEERQR